MTEQPIEGYESVKAWRRDLSEQWGGDPIAEEPERIGDHVISAKWREHYAQKIKEFRERYQDEESRRLAANVLSFLIHNGVLLQI